METKIHKDYEYIIVVFIPLFKTTVNNQKAHFIYFFFFSPSYGANEQLKSKNKLQNIKYDHILHQWNINGKNIQWLL